MKTVKDVSVLTGVSIRTLRYYDKIGLLKPAGLTEAGYRLYGKKELEKLQEILFFRELDIPLDIIKEMIDDTDYDRKQALSTQKSLLEKKRNRINGIIELITDVLEGVDTMSFKAFNNDDIIKMVDHMLAFMPKETLEEQVKIYGSMEKYREHLTAGFSDEQATAELFKWYGSKEKALEAVIKSTGNNDELRRQQDENEIIYIQFVKAKETNNTDLADDAVIKLAECYKKMFKLDNARNILLDLAKEYLQSQKLSEVIDEQYGAGSAKYIALAIQHHYGIEK